MNIRNLIDLLPPIFKAQDTYKVNGKGFLERYLEICGNYLTDTITPDIDNILDIIQIDTTPKEYLNYLWEFLGEIPFANIYNIDKGKWDMNYDGTNLNEDIWLIENNKPIALNDQTARDLIKYSLSLYKIRGTKKFFDTILRLYGMECTISYDDPDYNIVIPYLDTINMDRDTVDVDYKCKQCSNIRVSIDDRYHELVFADIDGTIIMGSDEKIFTGKSLYVLGVNIKDEVLTGSDDNILMGSDGNVLTSTGYYKYYDIEELVVAYNSYEGTIDFYNLQSLPSPVRLFVSLRRLFESFFDRFTPFNGIVSLEFDGITPNDSVEFDVLYDDPDHSIININNKSINLRVIRTGKWPDLDKRYQVSRNGIDWNGKYHDSDLYPIINPGTYYFKMVSDNKVVPISVGSSILQNEYSINIKEGSILYLSDYKDGIGIITPVAKFGDISIDTTVEYPNGVKRILEPNSVLGLTEAGVYRVYISNNPSIYKYVYVYEKPFDITSRVDIPYGIKIVVDTPDGIKTIGEPNNETVPVLVVTTNTQDKVNKVISIEPWLRDPKDLNHIMYGSEFITNDSHVICFLNRKASEDRYHQIDSVADSQVSKPISIEVAKELLNTMFKLSNQSAILTLAQVNISPYYDPHSIDQSNPYYPRLNYLHNPLVINTVTTKSDGYLNTILNGNSLEISHSISNTEDVFILGALLMDNRYYISNFYIWNNLSPNKNFDYPYYVSTLQVDSTPQSVNINSIKFKDNNGNTIHRQLVVMGRTKLELVNSVPIFISDTNSLNNGLYIDPVGDKDNWSEEILLTPLQVEKSDGTTIEVSKIYTVRLNNGIAGKQNANFMLRALFNGINYDDTSEGGIVIDDIGNPYNLRTKYIKDTIRYYIPRPDGNPLTLGNHGYIFSVKSLGSDPQFTVMLNIVIDEKAVDRLDVEFTMDPNIFYLPKNGSKAITRMIASRPYNFNQNDIGVFIYGPHELDNGDNSDSLTRDPVYEFTTDTPGSYTFNASGIVDPLSIINNKPEYPNSKEQVFTVKNSSDYENII